MNIYSYIRNLMDSIYTSLKRSSNLVAVVIPIYREELSKEEEISLKQVAKVLGRHPIYLVLPEGLSTDAVTSKISIKVGIVSFNKKYFRDLTSYNILLLSRDFYERFINYEYILIFQLDAFVFNDQLEEWCNKKYDFIGAPWIGINWLTSESIKRLLPFWIKSKKFKKIICRRDFSVGNGGFSLRKVRSFLLALAALNYRTFEGAVNEDIFWSIIVPSYLPFFRTPSSNEALGFSFELEPSWCYEMNKNILPFGCHGWWKRDMDFWRPFFNRQGYQI